MNKPPHPVARDWTTDKLERVRRYLEAYQVALKNTPFYRIYIDAFAGTGYNTLQEQMGSQDLNFPEFEETETRKFIDGSTRNALKVDPPFDLYTFIEKSSKRFATLQSLKNEFPLLNIDIQKAETNAYLQNLCQQNWQDKRAVLFLDPFAMQVTWDTIKAIARTGAIDLWLLFPLMAVNRLLKKDGNIPDPWRMRLDDMFGDSEWFNELYKPEAQQGLFGQDPSIQKTANFRAIESYFVRRLKSEFPAVADNPLTLKTPGGTPLFLLCFAISNPAPKAVELSMRIAKHILGKKKSSYGN